VNQNNEQQFTIGKAPSKMTVSVSKQVTTVDSTIVISGNVIDVSPGTERDDLRLRFPNGIPAVGDESIDEWMRYIYKQYEPPASVRGIEITVFADDGKNVIPYAQQKAMFTAPFQ
jgi:hypothetical protein